MLLAGGALRRGRGEKSEEEIKLHPSGIRRWWFGAHAFDNRG